MCAIILECELVTCRVFLSWDTCYHSDGHWHVLSSMTKAAIPPMVMFLTLLHL